MKKRCLFLILLVLLCSIAAVSAAENATDGLQSIEDVSINQETDVKLEKIDENVNIEDNIVESDENKTVLQSSGDDVLTAGAKPISQLRNLVQKTPQGGTLVLNFDYVATAQGSSDSLITLDKKITIDGQGHYIDAAHYGRIFDIEASGVTLKNINFKQGLVYRGPGMEVLCQGSDIKIMDCTFTGCTYVHYLPTEADFNPGYGALAIFGDNTQVINCIFDDNTGWPAHIYIDGNDNQIINCKIGSIPSTRVWANQGEFEGSAWEDLYPEQSFKVTGNNNIIRNCAFTAAEVTRSNVQLMGESNTIKDCTFYGLKGPKGAIYIDSKKNTIESCRFSNINPVDWQYDNGGAIYINSNENIIKGCYFEGCYAKDGGAVYINRKNNKVLNCIFYSNVAREDGGAIYCDSVSEIKYNLFINNTAKRGSDLYSSSKISGDDNCWGNVASDKNIKYAKVNNKVAVSSWYYAKLMSIYEARAPIGEKIPVKLVTTSDRKSDSDPNKYISYPVGSPSFTSGITSDSELSSIIIGLSTDCNTVYLTVPNKTSTTVKTKMFNKDISLTINTTDINYFTGLNNLIQSSRPNIDLDRDYEYFEAVDSAFENGILVGADYEGDYNTITIDGHGHTIDGKGLSRVFVVDSNCQLILKNINFINIAGYAILARYSMNPYYLTVENCTFTNINGGPAIYSQRYTKVTDTAFTNCTSKVNGGAICIADGTMFYKYDCMIDNSTFINCSSSEYGGSVYMDMGTLDIRNSKFINSKAKDGGAIYNIQKDAGNKTSIINSTFMNIDYSTGAAVKTNSKELIVDNSTFTNINGGTTLFTQGNTKVTNTDFINCTAKNNNGGAICQESGKLDITNSKFINIKAKDGGAIYNIQDDGDKTSIINSTFMNIDYSTGAAVKTNSKEMVIDNSTFTNINGGTAILTQGNTKVTNTDFINCTAKNNNGGAISQEYGKMDIANSKFEKTLANNGGAIYLNRGTINIANSSITNSEANQCGGAIYLREGSLNISKSKLTNNKAKEDGGAIFINDENITIIDSEIAYSSAENDGGAIYLNTGTINITNSNITNNKAGIDGGAIDLRGGTINLVNSKLTNNKAAQAGGAIYQSFYTLNITGSELSDNKAGANGGAIYLDTGIMDICDSKLIFNEGKNGGAVYVKDVKLGIDGSEFIDNEAKKDGGAIYDNLDDNKANNQKTSISNSKFMKNLAAENGGGINVNVGQFTVDNCTFEGNVAEFGGGIWSNKNSRIIKNSKFIENDALEEAGAIRRGTSEKLELINDTFYYNTDTSFDTLTESFSDLQKLVNNANGTLILYQMNYKFDPKTDKNLESGILINKPLEIVGENTVIDGSNAAKLFRVESPNVSIKSLSLINGKNDGKGGAIYWHGSNGKLENSLLQGNLGKIGGAVYAGSPNLTIDSCKFIKNYATYRGGAVYVGNKNTNIVNNLFKDNQATSGFNKAIYWGDRKWISLYKNNTFINNTQFDKGGNAEDYNEYSQATQQYNSKQSTSYRSIGTITANNKQISIQDNKLTLDLLNQIFDKDFRNGHLLVYIDGILVFNATTTDNLLQVILDLLSLLSGDHEIKVVFTSNDGQTNTYTENITI